MSCIPRLVVIGLCLLISGCDLIKSSEEPVQELPPPAKVVAEPMVAPIVEQPPVDQCQLECGKTKGLKQKVCKIKCQEKLKKAKAKSK